MSSSTEAALRPSAVQFELARDARRAIYKHRARNFDDQVALNAFRKVPPGRGPSEPISSTDGICPQSTACSAETVFFSAHFPIRTFQHI